MAIKNENKLVKLYLSPNEYKKLSELAKDEKMYMSAYLRNLINVIYSIKNIDVNHAQKSGKLDFGGYGIEFSKDAMEDFINKIKEMVEDVDWEKLVTSVNIKPTKRINAKPKATIKKAKIKPKTSLK